VSTAEFPRSFLPDELDLGDWSAVQPSVEKLLAREVADAEDLERWLLDSSELQSAVSEERSRRYIAMTCNTEDGEAEQAYLHLVEKFMPAAKPWFHRLNLFYLGCEARGQLDMARYGVLDRDVVVEMELYRDANIELQTQASVLSQKYQKISGAMTVQFRGEELTMPQLGKHLEVTDRAERQEAWEVATRSTRSSTNCQSCAARWRGTPTAPTTASTSSSRTVASTTRRPTARRSMPR